MRGQNGDKAGTVSVCEKNLLIHIYTDPFSLAFTPCLRWFLPCLPESLALVAGFGVLFQ
jgi:hypothetical protein